MRRPLTVLLAGCLALSGCAAVRVTHRPADGATDASRGTLVLKAVRRSKPEKLAGGFHFAVLKFGEMVGSCTSSKEAPTVLANLAPAPYAITISGKRMNPRQVSVDVRAGEQTIVTLSVAKARYASMAEDFVTVTGKGLFYAGLAVLYVTVYLPVAALWDSWGEDSDDCMRCGSDPCRCPSPPPAPERKPDVRSLLKDRSP